LPQPYSVDGRFYFFARQMFGLIAHGEYGTG
jgi:hypothetical protein